MFEAFDEFNVSNMFLKSQYYDDAIVVNGHETEYDFTLLEANAWIDGYVKDEDGNPVEDALIEAWTYYDYYNDYNYYDVTSTTNSEGYFILGVRDGGWGVSTYNYHLIPDYMDTQNDFQELWI